MEDDSVKVSSGILLVRSKSGTSKIQKVLVQTKRGKKKNQVKCRLQKYTRERKPSKIPVWVKTYRRGVKSVHSVAKCEPKGTHPVSKVSLQTSYLKRKKKCKVCTLPSRVMSKKSGDLSPNDSHEPKPEMIDESDAHKKVSLYNQNGTPIAHPSESLEKYSAGQSEEVSLSQQCSRSAIHSDDSGAQSSSHCHISDPPKNTCEETQSCEKSSSIEDPSFIFLEKEDSLLSNSEESSKLIYKKEEPDLKEEVENKDSTIHCVPDLDDDDFEDDEDEGLFFSQNSHMMVPPRQTVIMSQYQSVSQSVPTGKTAAESENEESDSSDSGTDDYHERFIDSGLRRVKSDESKLYLDPFIDQSKKKIKRKTDDVDPILVEIPSDIFQKMKKPKRKKKKQVVESSSEDKSSPTEPTDTSESGPVKKLKKYKDTIFTIKRKKMEEDVCVHTDDAPEGDFCHHTKEPPEDDFCIHEKDVPDRDFCLHTRDVPKEFASSSSMTLSAVNDDCLHTNDVVEEDICFHFKSIPEEDDICLHIKYGPEEDYFCIHTKDVPEELAAYSSTMIDGIKQNDKISSIRVYERSDICVHLEDLENDTFSVDSKGDEKKNLKNSLENDTFTADSRGDEGKALKKSLTSDTFIVDGRGYEKKDLKKSLENDTFTVDSRGDEKKNKKNLKKSPDGDTFIVDSRGDEKKKKNNVKKSPEGDTFMVDSKGDKKKNLKKSLEIDTFIVDSRGDEKKNLKKSLETDTFSVDGRGKAKKNLEKSSYVWFIDQDKKKIKPKTDGVMPVLPEIPSDILQNYMEQMSKKNVKTVEAFPPKRKTRTSWDSSKNMKAKNVQTVGSRRTDTKSSSDSAKTSALGNKNRGNSSIEILNTREHMIRKNVQTVGAIPSRKTDSKSSSDSATPFTSASTFSLGVDSQNSLLLQSIIERRQIRSKESFQIDSKSNKPYPTNNSSKSWILPINNKARRKTKSKFSHIRTD